MTDQQTTIATPAEAETLDAGQWVQDANGDHWCLFQTHVMVHQWMWKAQSAPHYVALGGIPYPLGRSDIDEPEGFTCPHRRVQECGQCERCGAVVGDTERWRRMEFGAVGLTIPKRTGSSTEDANA